MQFTIHYDNEVTFMAFLKKLFVLESGVFLSFLLTRLVIVGFLVYFCPFHILMKIKITKKLPGKKNTFMSGI